MPRLLHVIRDLDHGGAATQLRLLAAAGRGEAVAVACLRRPGRQFERFSAIPVPVVWTAKRFRVDPFALVALRRETLRGRAEVLQSWDSESAALCRVLRRWLRIRWVHAYRGGSLPSMAGVDAVLASDATAAEAARGATNAPITIVPNAFDPAMTPTGDAEKGEARRRLRAAGWDVADDAPVIVSVTRIDDAVATKEIAWASDLVRVVRPGLRLLIAGEGTQRMACERFAAKATERGTVQWLGPCDDLATLYAAADVVWVGRGAGAAPTPAVEAMAAGKPLVMADGPGREALLPHDEPLPQDTLLPQDTSSTAPPRRVGWNDRAAWAKATMRLLADKPLAAALGAANAQRVRDVHHIDAVAASHQAALSALPLE